jgi:hypothetical protein
MDPLLKFLINNMKCPLCKGQIEGTKHTFYCVTDASHYTITIPGDDPPWVITSEKVILNDRLRQYEIIQEQNSTYIFIWTIDAEGRTIDKDSKKDPPFVYPQRLFNFSQTDREKILNRVKTLLVFQ